MLSRRRIEYRRAGVRRRVACPGPAAWVVSVLMLAAAGCSAPAMETAALPPLPVPPWASPHGTEHALAGQVWRRRDGAFVAPQEMLATVAAAPFVIVGEKHDNLDQHRLEAWVVQALIAHGRRPAVAFEMLTLDQQPAIAAFLDSGSRDTAALGEAVGWSRRGWPPWVQYQPISQHAVDAGLPLVAADLPRETVRRIGREGLQALGEDKVARLGLDRPMADDARAAMRRQLMKSHCNMLPAELAGTMVDMQRAREAQMAYSLIVAARGADIDGAVLVTGFGHARTDLGVPRHLARMAGEGRTASLALIEVQDTVEGPGDLADIGVYGEIFETSQPPFDFVWFVPRVDDEDPCSKYRDQLNRLREPAER